MKLEKFSRKVAKKLYLVPRLSKSHIREFIARSTSLRRKSIDIMSGAEIKQYWPYAAELQRRSRAARGKKHELLRRGG